MNSSEEKTKNATTQPCKWWTKKRWWVPLRLLVFVLAESRAGNLGLPTSKLLCSLVMCAHLLSACTPEETNSVRGVIELCEVKAPDSLRSLKESLGKGMSPTDFANQINKLPNLRANGDGGLVESDFAPKQRSGIYEMISQKNYVPGKTYYFYWWTRDCFDYNKDPKINWNIIAVFDDENKLITYKIEKSHTE